MKKKVVSILVVLCMIISAMPAFAYFPDDTAVPELGVLKLLDFETASTTENVAYTMQTNYGGDMYYANGFVAEESGNKYFTHNVDGSKLHYGIRERVNGTQDAITTGILRLQYDVRVPYPEGINGTNDVYFGVFNVGEMDRAFLNTVSSKLEGPEICFANAIHDGAKPTSGADHTATEEIEFDKWYTVTMVIDYANGRVLQFLDGKRVAGFIQTPANVAKFLGFNNAGLAKAGAPALRSDFIHIDNFLVERIDNEKVDASVTNINGNKLDLVFDGALLANDTFTASNFTLKNLDGSDGVKAQDIQKLSVNSFRLTFAEDLVAGENYEIAINADVTEAGTNLTMVKGQKIFFSIPGSGDSLIDINFNDKENHFATAENSADFNRYYYQSASTADETTDFVTQKDLTYQYATVTSRGDGETGTNYRILQFKHLPTDPDHKSLVFPFENGEVIDDGKIVMEFEVMSEGVETVAGSYDMAFGLHDTKNTATEYNYSETWADATMFGGLVTYSGKQKDLSPALATKRSKLVTWYAGPGTVAGNQASDWNASYRLANVNFTGKSRTTEMDKYKIVVDLDNDFFELYLNGVLKYTSTYMPGGINDGAYDAFVITTLHGTSDYPNYLYFDNLKVTHESSEKPLSVDSASFTVSNEVAPYTATVDSSVKKMTIKMSESISAAGIENYVTFSGNDSCEISADGNEITLDFADGLTSGNNYSITLSKDLASSDGTVLGKDVVLSFFAKAGEIKYGTPIITMDGFILLSPGGIEPGLNIEVTVNAKEGVNCTATIMLVSYVGGKVDAVAFDTVSSTTGSLVFETLADDFVGADVVKAFVFESANTLKPLAQAKSIGE